MATVIVRRLAEAQTDEIKYLIRERGLSLGSFAEYAGVNPQTLSRWLSGRTSCQAATELKVWRALRNLQPAIGLGVPPRAVEVIERLPRLQPLPTRGESGRWVAQRRETEAQLPVARFVAALRMCPPWEAWRDFGYHLVASPRQAALFREYLTRAEVWLAFPETFCWRSGKVQ